MAVDIKIRADAKQLKKLLPLLKQTGTEFERLRKKGTTSANTMTGSFRKLSTVLGPLGVAGGVGAVSLAMRALVRNVSDFETAMAEVSTLVDTSTVSMRGLTNQILNLTTRVPRSAADISKGLYQTISAGITDTSQALDVLEISTRAAVGGLSDTNTAVDAITTVLNAYRLNTSKASKVSDVFFETVKQGKTRFPELASAIGVVASSAALANVSFEEVGASIATITKAGISTDIAVTALNRLFLSIVNPTKQLKDKAAELGIEFSAAELRAKGFSVFIRELTEAFSKDQDAIFALGLDIRAFRALSILGGTGAAEFVKQVDNMAKSAGAAEEAFQKMNRTTAATFERVKNEFNVEIQTAGKETLPVLTTALQQVNLWLLGSAGSVTKFTKTFDERFLNTIKKSTRGVDAFTSAIQALLAAQAQRVAGEVKDEKDQEEIIKAIQEENTLLLSQEAFQRHLNQLANAQLEKIKVRIPRDRETVNLAVTRVFTEQRTKEILTTQLETIKNIAAEQGEVAVNAIRAEEAIDTQANSASQLGDRILSAAFAMRALVDAARGGSLTLSSILGAASFIPGPQQPFLRAGSLISGAFGFQHGGQFTVGGAGGVDSQFVGFKATPGETVTVTTPNQTINSNNRTTTTNAPIFNLSFSGFPADDFQLRKFVNRLSQMVENGEIHITASEIA